MDKVEEENKQIEVKDKRAFCKYGAKCYQKHPDHHKKFRHPPSNKETAGNDKNINKKRKTPPLDKDESSSAELPKPKKQSLSPSSTELTESTKQNQSSTESTEGTTKKNETPSLKEVSTAKDAKEKVSKPIAEQNDDPYSEAKKLISKLFLVSMPSDFYKFYDFCNELKPSDPSTAFKIADIKLVGPYDVLNGLITKNTPNNSSVLTHWRYYYDPPEFQTILKGNDKEGLHFGYWRDRPSTEPIFVVTNCCNVSHKIKPVAENVFGAVANYLEERAKKANPFEKTGLFNLLGKIKAYAKKYDITLETQTPKMKSREKNVVARTIHGTGIVCPYNKKSQLGYRELSITDNQLLKLIKKIEDAKTDEERAEPRGELGEVVRLATIAGDECDFGTCLELGHDLLSTGCVHVQNAALAVLSIAYNQLERQAFLRIFEAHMKNRKKGCNLSALASATTKECTNNIK